MKTLIFIIFALVVYKVFNKPEDKIDPEPFKNIPVVDTTGTWHDDFDSTFTFNGSCIGKTFKENHICKQ
jgi:hypothetical protein